MEESILEKKEPIATKEFEPESPPKQSILKESGVQYEQLPTSSIKVNPKKGYKSKREKKLIQNSKSNQQLSKKKESVRIPIHQRNSEWNAKREARLKAERVDSP